MGQKVNPIGYRIGISQEASSKWFASKKDYSDVVLQDYKIRQLLEKELATAGLIKVVLERSVNAIRIRLQVAKPGVVIGKGGSNLEVLKTKLEKLLGQNKIASKRDKIKIDLNVEEVRTPELSAKLVAERISGQLVKRFPHRRAVNQALEKATQAGAKGIKIQLSGRIGGAEIGRTEKYFEGSIPTQTLRAPIDYYETPVATKSGYVGLKVWIYKGDKN